MAKLSVVMPVYREKERFVRQAIESILNLANVCQADF